MKRYLLVATQKELELPAAKQAVQEFGYTPIVTGVGGINIIRRVRNLPREAYILNVGYVGSPNLPIGTEVHIGIAHAYHPGITFLEEDTIISTDDFTHCYTAGDFVEGSAQLPPDCVVDMELAYIAAFGFDKLAAVKYVSDNLDYNQYQESLKR